MAEIDSHHTDCLGCGLEVDDGKLGINYDPAVFNCDDGLALNSKLVPTELNLLGNPAPVDPPVTGNVEYDCDYGALWAPPEMILDARSKDAPNQTEGWADGPYTTYRHNFQLWWSDAMGVHERTANTSRSIFPKKDVCAAQAGSKIAVMGWVQYHHAVWPNTGVPMSGFVTFNTTTLRTNDNSFNRNLHTHEQYFFQNMLIKGHETIQNVYVNYLVPYRDEIILDFHTTIADHPFENAAHYSSVYVRAELAMLYILPL